MTAHNVVNEQQQPPSEVDVVNKGGEGGGASVTTGTSCTVSLSSNSVGGACQRGGVDDLLEDIHKWLILDGSKSQGVKPFLAAYFHKLRRMGIPLDMIFGGGVLLSEYTPGYIWTCESTAISTSDSENAAKDEPPAQEAEDDKCCMEIEISREQFKIYTASLGPDDPFTRLRNEGVQSVRLQKGKDPIPTKSCPWYHAKKMTDYFAMPIMYRGTFRGGFAWCTKTDGGFTDDTLAFFQKAMPAFSAVMRLQTNDKIMESLTERVEGEITERTTSLLFANHELEEANERIKSQAAAQLEHFACMSHEVRTPLNCIIGMSSLLLDEEDEDEALTDAQRDSIQLITESGNLLRTVVDDVLDYTKLASGHIDVHIKSCNLQEIIVKSLRAFSGQCQAHHLNLRAVFGPTVPEFIDSDQRRLSQILYNLIGNAVKFSKDGGTIDINLTIEEDNKQKQPGDTDNKQQQVLKLSIKDYGKGIEKKHLDHIFEAFYQTDTRTSESTYGGTGLGLSIASKIVNGLGGTITADSQVGKWCEFTVELPLNNGCCQVVDQHHISKVLQDVAIAVIDPDDDRREKLVSDILAPYGVDAQVLNSCDDLGELSSSAAARSYVIVCDDSLYDVEKLDTFTRWEGERRVTIIACGAASASAAGSNKVTGHADYRFEHLSLLFPSVVIQKLCEFLENKLSGRAVPRIRAQPTPEPSVQELTQKKAPVLALEQDPVQEAAEETPISTPQPPPVQETQKAPMFDVQSSAPETQKATVSASQPPVEETQKAPPMFAVQPPVQQAQQANISEPQPAVQETQKPPPMFALQTPIAPIQSAVQETRPTPMFSVQPPVPATQQANPPTPQPPVQDVRTTPMFSVQPSAPVTQQQANIPTPQTPVHQKTHHQAPMFALQPPVHHQMQNAPAVQPPVQQTQQGPMFAVQPSVQQTQQAPMFAAQPPPIQQTQPAPMFAVQPPPVQQTQHQAPMFAVQQPSVPVSQQALVSAHPPQVQATMTNTGSATATIAAKPPDQAAAKTSASTGTSEKKTYESMRVLITEDNRINQKVLHKALERLGLQSVDIVDNGAKAVAVTSEKQFDLIFMDIQMPVMDGIEATKLITSRRAEASKHEPTVVFVSAHATESYREKAMAAGGDGFIAKPFQLPKIKDALQLVLKEDS